ERLAMYLQKVDHFLDLTWVEGISYRDVYFRNEVQQSKFNFEQSRPELLFQWFEQYADESRRLCGEGLPLPAYDYCMKCSHPFNRLAARGASPLRSARNTSNACATSRSSVPRPGSASRR